MGTGSGAWAVLTLLQAMEISLLRTSMMATTHRRRPAELMPIMVLSGAVRTLRHSQMW